MNADSIVAKIERTVQAHRLSEGAYSRYLWQDEAGSRKMGVNEYGCADAANILYTIGRFEGDADKMNEFYRHGHAIMEKKLAELEEFLNT